MHSASRITAFSSWRGRCKRGAAANSATPVRPGVRYFLLVTAARAHLNPVRLVPETLLRGAVRRPDATRC